MDDESIFILTLSLVSLLMLVRPLLVASLFLGCAVKQPTPYEQKVKVSKLTEMIVQLSSTIHHDEAYRLAKNSIEYSQYLAKKYEVIASPWMQNSLVNIGVKKRGLCHEWAEDLWSFLVEQNYGSVALHAIGANIGYLNEHNALAVSASGEGIENSIILDAWRDSGNLYFKKIDRDSKYEWRERFGLYKRVKK